MIKVYMTTTGNRRSDMFEETTTIREIFKAFDVDYAAATNLIDGDKIGAAGMDKTLAEWGVKKECRISSIIKMDNAADVEINGAAAVLTSGVTLENWKRIEKYAPELLKITDEDGDVLFKVKTCCCGGGSVDENGVCFGPEAYTNKDGYATVTILLDPSLEDKRAAVKEIMGSALIDLNSIEKEVPAILKDIDEKEAEIDSLITTK